ncbi:MAG: 6-pyruvoyl trahydropterin synthase family protein [Planctomycetota bacterium]|jgi:6-pyruvoyltetrahydropterin/6-carboxytetrahydropterin synthase
MHKLARQVRFSINPFLAEDSWGHNSYASKPAGEGLSIFFELCVELTGEVDATTGFVVNVLDIDRRVRDFVVPIFARRVRECFRRGEHIAFLGITEILLGSQRALAGKFGSAKLSRLTLALNPFRRITLDDGDDKMMYFSEKFEFAAMHKLWNEDFSEDRNRQVFGKCANPAGHGHNYVVEVTLSVPENNESFRIGDFERIVDDDFIKFVDHKNLNVDVAELIEFNPTVENIAVFAWNKLDGKFSDGGLHCVTVWETDKTWCSYYGR